MRVDDTAGNIWLSLVQGWPDRQHQPVAAHHANGGRHQRQGLAHTARHVIQRIYSSRLLNYMATWRAISARPYSAAAARAHTTPPPLARRDSFNACGDDSGADASTPTAAGRVWHDSPATSLSTF
jgi:hypothetical protein